MTDDFAPDGQLAKAIPGFKPREPQRQMAVAVAQSIQKSQPLVVEAGTGTGKPTPIWHRRCAQKESDYLDRFEGAAGSALQPRSSDGRQRAEVHRKTGPVERTFKLFMPGTPRTTGAGGRRSARSDLKRCDPAAVVVESDRRWRHQHLRQRG